MPRTALPVNRRREIFRALVESQDRGVPVAESKELVADAFDVTEDQVQEIEDEGLEKQWPPLS